MYVYVLILELQLINSLKVCDIICIDINYYMLLMLVGWDISLDQRWLM